MLATYASLFMFSPYCLAVHSLNNRVFSKQLKNSFDAHFHSHPPHIKSSCILITKKNKTDTPILYNSQCTTTTNTMMVWLIEFIQMVYSFISIPPLLMLAPPLAAAPLQPVIVLTYNFMAPPTLPCCRKKIKIIIQLKTQKCFK